jgi:hypothetical protein
MEKKIKVISDVSQLLQTNTEWHDRYKGYIENISEMQKYPKEFRKPIGLSVYTSVSKRDRRSFDLRFQGQSVATIKKGLRGPKKGWWLIPQTTNKKSFEKYGYKDSDFYEVELQEATKFRSFFAKLSKESECIKTKSPEHALENALLREFSKAKREEGKALCNIQPVTLYDCFFQMPTPLRASDTHKQTEYSAENGGGIDILARVKYSPRTSRLCIIEVKDENKPSSEPQSKVMEQALSYAVFIATLIQDKQCGQKWWDFFMGRKDGKSKPVPKHIDIFVVTAMPPSKDGSRDNDFKGEIPIGNVTYHCYPLYFKKADGEFIFSGDFTEEYSKIQK